MSDYQEHPYITNGRIVGQRLAEQLRQLWDESIWPSMQQSAHAELARQRYRQMKWDLEDQAKKQEEKVERS